MAWTPVADLLAHPGGGLLVFDFFHMDAVLLRRVCVLVAKEVGRRQVYLLAGNDAPDRTVDDAVGPQPGHELRSAD